MILHTRQVLYTATPHQHNRVLLQVMPFAWNVGDHLNAIGQPHLGDLSKRGVRFFWRRSIDACAHAAPLGIALQRRRFCFPHLRVTAFAHQLLNGRHVAFRIVEFEILPIPLQLFKIGLLTAYSQGCALRSC